MQPTILDEAYMKDKRKDLVALAEMDCEFKLSCPLILDSNYNHLCIARYDGKSKENCPLYKEKQYDRNPTTAT